MKQEALLIQSTYDGSMQPSLYYSSDSCEKRPLFVGLHTWSYDRFNQVQRMVPWAKEYDFNLLLPEFRGPNLETNSYCSMACASPSAMQDVMDAVQFVIKEKNADPKHVLLYGESGGGHMALMMAGYCPEVFEAVAAFVPITDLERWAEENELYRPHILACCGNSVAEMRRRSPIHHIDEIAKANIKLFHGKFDPTVSVKQSLAFYTVMMERHPHARVFLDIFDGGHETDEAEALHWLLSQITGTVCGSVSG